MEEESHWNTDSDTIDDSVNKMADTASFSSQYMESFCPVQSDTAPPKIAECYSHLTCFDLCHSYDGR
jgi:hypothetical protein